jgi:hypothetical protein
MNNIPESYLRCCGFESALLCWALYGNVYAACIISIFGARSGILPTPESMGTDIAGMITGMFLILSAIEGLVYLLFLKRYLNERKKKALQEYVATISDPELLAQLSHEIPGSDNYYELAVQGYQDFTYGLGYTTVLLFLPGMFIGMFLQIPLIFPLGEAELTRFFLGQILGAALWYKLGFYRIYRRGRIKNLTRGKGVDITAPRPGLHK